MDDLTPAGKNQLGLLLLLGTSTHRTLADRTRKASQTETPFHLQPVGRTLRLSFASASAGEYSTTTKAALSCRERQVDSRAQQPTGVGAVERSTPTFSILLWLKVGT